MTDDQTPDQTPEEKVADPASDLRATRALAHLANNPQDARVFSDENVDALNVWVEHLRSGRYQQGRGSLVKYRIDVPFAVSDALNERADVELGDLADAGLVGFCCIGVAAVVFGGELKRMGHERVWMSTSPDNPDNVAHDGGTGTTSTYVREVMKATGLVGTDMIELTALNDGARLDFFGMADVLEVVGEHGISVRGAARVLGHMGGLGATF